MLEFDDWILACASQLDKGGLSQPDSQLNEKKQWIAEQRLSTQIMSRDVGCKSYLCVGLTVTDLAALWNQFSHQHTAVPSHSNGCCMAVSQTSVHLVVHIQKKSEELSPLGRNGSFPTKMRDHRRGGWQLTRSTQPGSPIAVVWKLSIVDSDGKHHGLASLKMAMAFPRGHGFPWGYVREINTGAVFQVSMGISRLMHHRWS